MDRDGWISEFDKELAAEKFNKERLAKTTTAQQLDHTQTQLADMTKSIGGAGNIQQIILLEKTFLAHALEHYSNSVGMKTSLETALHELQAAENTVSKVGNTETYSEIVNSIQNHKRLKDSLPLDDAREFFKAHRTRLMNSDKVGLTDTEKALVRARLLNIRTAEKLYIEQQKKTLGIETAQTRSRGLRM